MQERHETIGSLVFIGSFTVLVFVLFPKCLLHFVIKVSLSLGLRSGLNL